MMAGFGDLIVCRPNLEPGEKRLEKDLSSAPIYFSLNDKGGRAHGSPDYWSTRQGFFLLIFWAGQESLGPWGRYLGNQ